MKKATGIIAVIKEYFDSNTKKGIAVTIICAALLAVVNFGFKNASLPKQEAQINSVDTKTTALISKDSAKTIQIILLRNDVNDVEKKMDAVQVNMDKGFDRIERRLNEIIKQTK